VRGIGWGWKAFGEGGLWRRLVLRRAPAVDSKDAEAATSPEDPGEADGER
jgi:hypothetical protein